MTKRQEILTLRRGYADALIEEGEGVEDAIISARLRYPMPMKKVPFVTHLSNGSSFKIEHDLVWIMLSVGGEWRRSGFNVNDLIRLGVLAKQPTLEVEDE
jgi:hypothetical protein